MTHFVASLGTCGTITGAGRFLKEQNPDVKVIGVHPTDGHDIPGVRSRRALAVTDFFTPDEYDGIIEITDDEAYGLCRRLHLEESIIAGPSCGLALAGALRAIPDEPGVVAVVVFPDNAFKYLSSFRRHLPDLFPPEDDEVAVAGEPVRRAPGGRVRAGQAGPGRDRRARGEAAARCRASRVIDVRNPPEVARVQIPESLKLSLPDLSQGSTEGLPVDLDDPGGHDLRRRHALALRPAACSRRRGYRDVKSVDGGMGAWVAAGLPAAPGSVVATTGRDMRSAMWAITDLVSPIRRPCRRVIHHEHPAQQGDHCASFAAVLSVPGVLLTTHSSVFAPDPARLRSAGGRQTPGPMAS